MKKRSLIFAVIFAAMLTALTGCGSEDTGSVGGSNLASASSLLSESSAVPSSKPESESSAASTPKPESESSQESTSEVHSVSEDSEMSHAPKESRESEESVADSSPADEVSDSGVPEEMTDEYPDITGITVEIETEDYNEVLKAFAQKFEEASMAVPENSIYAISDFELRGLEVKTEQLKDGADFAGYIRYAVKPMHKYYVIAGGAEDGTGEYEGYILEGTGYYIHSENGRQWKAIERAY